MGLFRGFFVAGHNDPGGVEVVVQGLALPQKFRAENDVFRVVLCPDGGGVAHGDGGFNHHHGVGIGFQHQLDDGLHRGGVKEILLAVVVGGGGDDDKIRVSVGALAVQGGGQVQLLFRQILFDVFVLNRGFFAVDQVNLLRHDVHSSDVIMLCE